MFQLFISSISNSVCSQTWYPLNTETEDLSLLAYDDLSICKYSPMFWRIFLSLSSETKKF